MSSSEYKDLIKEWYQLEQKLQKLNTLQREMREQRKSLSDRIIAARHENESVFSPVDGVNIKFIKTREYEGLTFKYLDTCLSKYISDKEKAKQLIDAIKNGREVRESWELKVEKSS